jgi:hypothetical protein
VRPDKSDKASAARVLYVTFDQYGQRWDEIAGVFSRDAILRGSFDKYAEGTASKRGTAEVDRAFLAEIERWRDLLARSIALRNTGLSQRELNFAVQQTIDRIIFLRICEDRGIEPYGALLGLVNGAQVYERLLLRFRHADARYNSGLFYFDPDRTRIDAPDTLSARIAIDDRPLRDILKNLYYPDSPYEFSVLPADILGQVYEQFLGKVIRLTAGHRAVVEEKPEVRKAGGVYYTPTFIVDAIVRATLGKLLAGLTLRQAMGLAARVGRKAFPVRVADIACGSGSFLLGAYQFLLDWYLAAYLADGAHAKQWATGRTPRLYQSARGEWRLTIAERKRILLDHIFGVDIDPQAVEVTKLSLLLKVLEGEDEQTMGQQLALFPERALPDLGRNIKCGNSLIGPDFYEGQQLALLDDEAMQRVNVFDWRGEFPQVWPPSPSGRGDGGEGGGFDVIVGNPPYIRMETFKDWKGYLKAHYACHDERSDLYAYFIERAHSFLRPGGRFGMIVSNKFLRANYGRPLREYLYHNATIERVVDFAGLPVFVGATVRTIILISNRDAVEGGSILYSPPISPDEFVAVAAGSQSVEQAVGEVTYAVDPGMLDQPVWSFVRKGDGSLLTRLKVNHTALAEYCSGQICMGVKSGLTNAFVVDEETRRAILESNPGAIEIIKPFVNGRDVRRYRVDYKRLYLIYTFRGVQIEKYPAIEQHLRSFKSALTKRATRQEWYELQQPQLRFAPFMDSPKIIFPDIATTPRFALDESGYYGSNTTYFIPGRDLYLLGLLNSSLAQFYFTRTCAGLEGKNEVYLRFFGQYLEGFPTRTIDFTDPADVARHDRMVSLVEHMLDLHKRVAAEQVPHAKTMLQRQIETTDRQIDALVYELYGLTEAEVAVVEGRG